MIKKIQKPTDPYSAQWPEYWKQNPGMHKGVGADANAGDPPADPPATPTIDPAKFQEALDSIAKLEENNQTLLREKAEAKKAEQAAIEEAARKGGDVEALEKSWQQKLNDAVAERDGKLTAYQQTISDMTSGAAARGIAADIAIPGSADVLMPHIERRLKTEFGDGDPVIRVLDKNGKPSAMTVEDLKKEIESDKAFAPLIVGSKASGSGAAGGKGSGDPAKNMSRDDFDALAPGDKMAHIKTGGKVVD